MTSPHPIEQERAERERFEAWRRQTTRKKNPDDAIALEGFGDDADYADRTTRAMWTGWKVRAGRSLPQAQGWIPVSERLPGPGVAVLAFFRNKYGHARTVRAHHAPKHTIEASHWDEDAETDDTEDGSFEPEGWYEDPAVGEAMAFIGPEGDGVVTHWQPLPPSPLPAAPKE